MTDLPDANASRGRAGQLAVLGLLFLLAVLARCIGFERVFLEDGTVVFANSDAFYHARRALYTLLQFPDLLRFDACINYPDGASVPHAPGYDFVVAALARALGGSLASFERLIAWLPVWLGAMGVFPVFALAKMFVGRAAGFGAACLYALLPIAVNYSQVGNADHHAAAGLLGACLLATYATLLSESPNGRRSPTRSLWLFVALLSTRLAMLLVWHGSLLYLGVGEIAILLLAAANGRRDLLKGQAWSCLAIAILIVPVVANSATPRDGVWAATELSRLHVLLFTADALICGLLGGVLRSDFLHSPGRRLGAAVVACIATAGASLVIPGVQDALLVALGFLTKSDQWGASVLEQLPLFYESGALDLRAGGKWMGGIAYLLPLIPLAFVPLLEAREQRAPAALLIAWTLVFGVLAFSQVRFANDYAAAGCVGTTLLIMQASRWVCGRNRQSARAPLALLAGLLVLAPAGLGYYSIALEPTLAHLRGSSAPLDLALVSVEGTQLRFAQTVRRQTPEVEGCGPEPGRPHYGILAHPAIGHVLHYVARRATPADPFGPYIGQANYERLRRALGSSSEREVVEIATRLDARYVLTAADASPQAATNVMRRLHQGDGGSDGFAAHLGHFRLIAEGPEGGVALARLFEKQLREVTPYKLFEIVAGALLEVPSEPGGDVTAVVSVRVGGGRRFSFRARGVAGPDGVATLRVPYATGSKGTGGGRYTVVAGDRHWQVEVSRSAVREGRRLRVGAISG